MKVRALAAFVALCASGCGRVEFFEELQSADSVEEDTDSGDTDGGDTDGDTEAQPVGDCEFPADDRCGSQDDIEQCHPETLTYEAFDCHLLCGEFVNLSCITTGTARHACYCVEPGLNKQLSCTELESCLAGCGAAGACEDQCFSRTTTSTVRLYGSLVFCANDDCHQVCIDNPQLCGLCIQETIAEGRGMCGLPRSVCNNDINDDPNAPWG